MLYQTTIVCEEYNANTSTKNSIFYSLDTVSYESAILGAIKNMTCEYDGEIQFLTKNTAEFVVDTSDHKTIIYKIKAYNLFDLQEKGEPVIDF